MDVIVGIASVNMLVSPSSSPTRSLPSADVHSSAPSAPLLGGAFRIGDITGGGVDPDGLSIHAGAGDIKHIIQ